MSINRSYIDVAFRNDYGKRDIGGSVYDHYAIRKHTHYPTRIVHHESMSTSTLKKNIKKAEFHLHVCPGETLDDDFKVYPKATCQMNEILENGGLLFLPGISREASSHPEGLRKIFEIELIRKAKLNGKPILGVCGGAALLLESYGGSLEKVDNHNCRGGMPRIGVKNMIVNNREMHKICVEKDTVLGSVVNEFMEKIALRTEDIMVNSVHNFAPQYMPPILEKNAVACRDKQHPNLSESIEGFEAKFGAPVFGVLWHPEAYQQGPSKYFLRYMEQAGDAYVKKRACLKEFRQKAKKLPPNKL